jgi:hypothetical protein
MAWIWNQQAGDFWWRADRPASDVFGNFWDGLVSNFKDKPIPDLGPVRPLPTMPAPQTAWAMQPGNWQPGTVFEASAQKNQQFNQDTRYLQSAIRSQTATRPAPTPDPAPKKSNWPLIAALTAAAISAVVVFGGNR